MFAGLVLVSGLFLLALALWLAGITYDRESGFKRKPRDGAFGYLFAVLLFFLWPLLDFLWRKLNGSP